MSWGTHYGVRTDWTAQDYADALSKAQGEELRALAAEVNERWGETP
jgi:hypothetical protein